jgi:pyruvate/2-oxoglutarate dehydrogenase complex dihydrolipoamide acyltransferase (E2) component
MSVPVKKANEKATATRARVWKKRKSVNCLPNQRRRAKEKGEKTTEVNKANVNREGRATVRDVP